MLVVADHEPPIHELWRKFTRLQDGAILIAQHRQEQTAMHFCSRGIEPGNIEVVGIGGRWPMFEYIGPPGVRRPYRHVVRHDIENEPHVARMQIRHENMQVLVRADLRIEHAVVDDVVAVPASGPGFEHRRRVEMSDAERVQVWNERDGIAE